MERNFRLHTFDAIRLLLKYTEKEASFVDFTMKNEFSYFQLNCFTHMKEVSRKDLMC